MEASGSRNNSMNDSNLPNETANRSHSDVVKEKKIQLRKDIQELEELNFQIECAMNISKFGNIKHLFKGEKLAPGRTSRNIRDVKTEYMDEMFTLGGMCCTKCVDNEFVFSFFPSGNSKGKDTYAVQIIDSSTMPKIGKWVMPMSVDINNILLETPIDTPMELKSFLANCKHHIDCYTNRIQQYNELKSLLEDLSGCWLDSSLGHTAIALKFLDVKDLEVEQSYNIILHLIYKSNRVRPHKIKVESMHSNTRLTDTEVNKLRNYFKYFKCYDLKQAFEETVGAKDTQIIWQKCDQDDLNLSDNSVSSSEATFRTRDWKRMKTSRRRGKKRRAAEIFQHSRESEEPEQGSDDSEQADDPHPSLPHSINKRVEKAVRNKDKQQLPKNKGKQKLSKNKRTKSITTSPVRKPLKKGLKPKNNPKSNMESRANTSKTNLRQSTLDFQFEREKEVDNAQSKNDEPLNENAGNRSVATIITKKKTTRKTLLANDEFGTSTPISNSNRNKKRFVAESSMVSPIQEE